VAAQKLKLHDWVCDGCGKKIYKRRKPPSGRCHGYPLRPMGSPWKWATQKFYATMTERGERGASLPDDYWISEKVRARLQEIADERGVKWSGSVRSNGPYEAKRYEDLT
jgi:hypothetical protein